MPVVAVTLVAGCSLLGGSEPAEPAGSSPEGASATVAPGAPTELQVSDRWTVSVPPGSAPADAQVRSAPVDPVAVERLWGTDPARVLQTSDISLSSGQPSAPLIFTYRLDRPLPENEVLFLVSDTVDGRRALAEVGGAEAPSPSSVLVAEMNADRTVGTVTTDHLSLKTWLIAAVEKVTASLGEFAGQRHDPPQCSGTRPAWMSEAVYLDDRNAPMRVCVDVDPNDPGIAVVKIVNNRGGGILVSSPVTPSWAWQAGSGLKVSELRDSVANTVLGRLGVPRAERPRTWILPPGGEVHIGVSQAAVRDRTPFVVRGRMTPLTAAWGLAISVITAGTQVKGATEAAEIGLTLYQLGVLAECGFDAGVEAGRDGPALGRAVLDLTRCAVEESEAIVGLLTDQLGAQAWTRIKDPVLGFAGQAKFRGGPLLAIGTATFVLTDLVTTLATGEGAWTVALFARVVPTAPALTPAQVVNSVMPVGSCGDDTLGWPQPVPIQLRAGTGSALFPDGSFAGSSIDGAEVLGFADVDGDRRQDAVVTYSCFGSLPEQCCAGRTSRAHFVQALRIGPDKSLSRIGTVIKPGYSGPGDEYGPAERDITSATLRGNVVTTEEHLEYPEQYTAAQLGGQDPTAPVSVQHRFRDGRWVTL